MNKPDWIEEGCYRCGTRVCGTERYQIEGRKTEEFRTGYKDVEKTDVNEVPGQEVERQEAVVQEVTG